MLKFIFIAVQIALETGGLLNPSLSDTHTFLHYCSSKFQISFPSENIFTKCNRYLWIILRLLCCTICWPTKERKMLSASHLVSNMAPLVPFNDTGFSNQCHQEYMHFWNCSNDLLHWNFIMTKLKLCNW